MKKTTRIEKFVRQIPLVPNPQRTKKSIIKHTVYFATILVVFLILSAPSDAQSVPVTSGQPRIDIVEYNVQNEMIVSITNVSLTDSVTVMLISNRGATLTLEYSQSATPNRFENNFLADGIPECVWAPKAILFAADQTTGQWSNMIDVPMCAQ